MAIKRVAVLTCGGDAPGLNGVIRGIARAAENVYGAQVFGFIDGFKGMIENKYMVLDQANTSGILHRGGTILGTSNRDNPFQYPMGRDEGGKLIFGDVSDQAMGNLTRLGIQALIVIGGDGSLHMAHQFADKGVRVVGVPKTIDNDLDATDQTFGFDTAINTVMEALDRLHTTAESHHRIMVVEVMGRYAGWIALHSGMAGGADVILVPEIPYDLNVVIKKIQQRSQQGKHFSLVTVAEGAAEKEGQMVVAAHIEESTDPIRLGGVGQVVAEKLGRLTGLESRTTVLGHLQRGGSPTALDRILTTRLGVKAMETAINGPWNHMVSLRGNEIVTVPIAQAIDRLKNIQPDSEIVRAARAVGICLGDVYDDE
ncbi:MAG: ATP-dependent 6-phosphofructokinase [Peptococcaceae bacterium]|jgi:6-phosphofructokinase 1|nr:ATP-dependent 6-phosphofructokinase [Peptococcaceae bacterium]